MEVYIEYVIIDNFVIDYLIVYFTSMILNCKIKKVNKLISVVFGVVCAVILPLISIKIIYLFFVKVLVGLIMVAMLKKYANFREFLITCIVLFSITFLLAGVCYGTNEMFGINTTGGQVLINGFEFPVSVFVLFASIYIYLLIMLIKYLRNRNKLSNFYFDVKITQNNNKYFLRGYLDSGNKLFDDSQPVVVIPLKVFVKIFKDYPIEKVALGEAPNNPHYIYTHSVGEKNKILVLDLDEISIKNNEKSKVYTNVKLGISKASFSSDFDLLLHSSF